MAIEFGRSDRGGNRLVEVDGNRGKLIIRGRSLDDLAAQRTYEGVMAMLFEQFLDEPAPRSTGNRRWAPPGRVFQHLGSADAALLRAGTHRRDARAGRQDQDGNDPVSALHLVAAPAVFTAGLIRLRQGQARFRRTLAWDTPPTSCACRDCPPRPPMCMRWMRTW